MIPEIRPFPKQHEAYEMLDNDNIKYLLYGGGAGGGKSWLGCERLLTWCYIYPGSKWFIGRKELSRLMKSSYITFLKVCAYHKIPRNDWKLNGQYNYIEFLNGSRIDLLDVDLKPSDPDFERFGSLEYTGGWLEEAGEISFKAFDILKSRIGRHKNKEFGFKSRLLLTSNPNKGWLYSVFYKPWKDGKLQKGYRFLQALYTDNPHTAEEYGENLSEISDEHNRKRLMYGDWEYDDNLKALFNYDALNDVFSNTITKSNKKYLSVDVADDGSDKTVFSFWEGLEEYRRESFSKMNSESIIAKIREYTSKEQIPYSQVIVDAIGVGSSIASSSMLDGIIGYKSSYGAIKTDINIIRLPNISYTSNTMTPLTSDYKNLRSQCLFVLAEHINSHKIASKLSGTQKQIIIDELEKYEEVSKIDDNKRMATKKEDVKDALGRSPDDSDTWIMRMYFVVKEKMLPEQSEERSAVLIAQKNQFTRNRENFINNSNR